MPFIWRQKNVLNDTPYADAEALSCLDAAYVLLDLSKKTERFSFNLHKLLSQTTPCETLEQFKLALSEDSAEDFDRVLAAVCEGQVPPPVMLHLREEGRTLQCRATMVPQQKDGSQLCILWLYDVSSEARQQARLTLESEKLKNDIKLYSTILNMAPYPIWQRDKKLAIRYYNLAYSEIAEAADTVTDDAPELDRRARFLANQALQSGEPKHERRHIIVEGQRKLYDINELPISPENMVIGFGHDITEIETLQEDVQRYISAQSDLLESSASAMAVFGADMRLKSFNYAYAKLWRLEEQWLESQPNYGEILEAQREKRRLPEQANFVHFKQQQLRLFTDLIEPQEEFFYLPDGTALRIIVIPHALGGLLFAYEDVTDRLTLERSYNTLIAVQQETLDNLHEGIVVFGEDGKLKLCNPVYLSMWKIDVKFVEGEPHVSEVLDKVAPFYYFDNIDTFKAERAANIQSRKMIENRIERTDGKVIDCTIVPLPDGGTLLTYIDVTDSTLVERSLRERADALQEADKLKSEFLANMSYELRSPLTSISGFAEMLSGNYFGELSEKQAEYVQGIHESSQHLMHLVDDILDLASIEAGYLQLETSRFDLHALLKSMLSMLQERSRAQNVELKLECSSKIGKLLADETRLKQVLFKLLSNAIKFSPPESTITLGAKEENENTLVVFVRDTGYGIPQEELHEVFDKFYKGENKKVQKSVARTGTGLGLSIVKNFIELHGGEVEVNSAENEGTEISCILPRENAELEQFLQKKSRRKPTKTTKKNNDS